MEVLKDLKPRVDTKSMPNKNSNTTEAKELRVDLVEKGLGVDLTAIKDTKVKAEGLKGNIENFIGTVEVPVGLAGPLNFNFKDGLEEVYAPIATTEGALVTAISRGARAISLSGGIKSKVLKSVMTRCPFFMCGSLEESVAIYEWFVRNFSILQEKARSYSNYIELENIVPKYSARGIGVRFEYDTGDASGQNMTTVCTWNLCKWIVEELKVELGLEKLEFLIDGGWSSDKKASFSSAMEGRGKEVFAEAIIKKRVAERILRIDVRKYVKEINKCRSHSNFMGSIGFQLNVSNVIAGMFTSTGQDIACVHECSVANFFVEETDEGDLYISMHLPSLLVATVGGGTSLPGPKAMLSMMGCSGTGKVNRLAEIITGYCLALDLSTSTAIHNGSFAQAHDRLGRNRSVDWLKFSEINENFFNKNCDFKGDTVTKVKRDKEFSADKSLISELVSPVTRRVSGIYKFDLALEKEKEKQVVLKVKPLDEEVNLAFLMLAGLEDMELKKILLKYKPYSLFRKCHTKEQQILKEYSSKMPELFPKVYGTVTDHDREFYAIANEFLTDYKFLELKNPQFLKNERYIKDVIKSITPFHTKNYDFDIKEHEWVVEGLSLESMLDLKPVWTKLINFAHENFGSIVDKDLYAKHVEIINRLDFWIDRVEQLPKTLIHSDFNPRNIGYRSSDGSVKVIDWELAKTGLPHRDIVELLAYTTDLNLSEEDLLEIISFHKSEFEFNLQSKISNTDWIISYKYAIDEFLVHRLPLYFVAHAHRECEFLENLYKQTHHLIELLEGL